MKNTRIINIDDHEDVEINIKSKGVPKITLDGKRLKKSGDFFDELFGSDDEDHGLLGNLLYLIFSIAAIILCTIGALHSCPLPSAS